MEATWEEGSTNVFADLGHLDADEKLVKVERLCRKFFS